MRGYHILVLSIFSLLSCDAQQNLNISSNETKIESIKKQDSYHIDSLQGIWAVDENENALFFIEGDSLFYIEHLDKPIQIELNGDTLIILGDAQASCKILKLTSDSLWYVDNFTDSVTKLYRRE